MTPRQLNHVCNYEFPLCARAGTRDSGANACQGTRETSGKEVTKQCGEIEAHEEEVMR
jgi:hypothetical protein